MAMIVQHNVAAMNAQRQYGINTTQKAKNAEHLASGYRINRAADDAAGLAISEKMRSQIRGLAVGTRNTEEGISLCHVADGALNEVHDMLNRLKELSVQAANGTNCVSDREMIQDEVEQLLEEIDRIGNDTEFNTMPIFKGSTELVVDNSGEEATVGDIPFSDFVLADINLGRTPLYASDSADMLHLQAIVNNSDSVFDGMPFNLIFGNGSTSHSSIKVTSGGVSSIITLREFAVTNYETDGTDTWKKEFKYSDGVTEIGITQKVKIENTSDTEKNYLISYEFTQSSDIDRLEFMFHADTAYNNNDRCEGYYIDGNRVEKFCVYDTGSDLIGTTNSQYLYNETPPSSFSIVDVDQALAFSEKISFQNGTEPDSLSIGYYYDIWGWDYYNNLDTKLGKNADHKDLGFSLYYDLSSASRNNKVTFKYGIISTETDTNIQGIDTVRDTTTFSEHSEEMELWIQSGANEGEGMYLTIGEMNTKVLGIRNLNVSTFDGAQHALKAVDIASQKVSSIRSVIGAQQNRLEHTVLYNENTLENTTAAESRIRDVDMAKELVADAKYNILMQTSQAMLSQTNKMADGLLQLLNA